MYIDREWLSRQTCIIYIHVNTCLCTHVHIQIQARAMLHSHSRTNTCQRVCAYNIYIPTAGLDSFRTYPSKFGLQQTNMAMERFPTRTCLPLSFI